MADPRYGYYTPRAHAVIDGKDIAISSFQADFPLNGIPRCQIALPTGRSTRTNIPAAIHVLGSELGAQARIQVYASFTPTAKSDQKIAGLGLPEKDTIVFDGYTCGGGMSRSTSHVGFTLVANGGLVQMSQASALSDSSCTSNPSNYSYPSLMAAATAGSLNANPDGGDWTVATRANKFFTPATIQADLWGKAIYPWLKDLTGQDALWVNEPGLKGEGTNKQAAAALELLAPQGKLYIPLAIKSTLALDVDAATEIGRDIGDLTHNASFTANQTMWDILVGHFAANYGFAVVSRSIGGIVVPYLGGCSGNELNQPYLTIKAGEYDSSDHQVMRPRPLRAYGVMSALRSPAGSVDTLPADIKMGIGGWYDAGKDVNGSVLIEQAPRWLAQTTSFSRVAAESAGAKGKPIGSAPNPGGTSNNAGQDSKKRATKLIKPLLDAYAQVRFAQEVLKGRSLVVSGAFRLDIAPGSLIGVEGAYEQFLTVDKLATALVGDVQQVSIALDAERPAAGVSFHVGNVRTRSENAVDKSSIKSHPLFEKTFIGCPLIDI